MENHNQQLQGDENNPDDEGSWDEEDSEDEEDDEATLDEEEALDQDNAGDEINALQHEQDIPIEELLKMYGYGDVSSSEVESQAILSSNSAGLANQVATISSTSNEGEMYAADAAGHGYFSDVDDEQDEASDEEYIPREALRREIRVGPEYQADVPSVTGEGSTPTENGTNECAAMAEQDVGDDLLLWKPGDTNEDQVEQFLRKAHEITATDDDSNEVNGSESCQRKKVPADDEAALRALMQSHYDPESALTEHIDEIASASRQGPEFSEAEIQAFESGLETFGKNFCRIKAEKLPQRTVSELVRYYYMWKSTYRHEMFATRMRMLRLQKQLEQQQAALNSAAANEAPQHSLYPETGDVHLHHIRGLDPHLTRNASVSGELCSQSDGNLNFESDANAAITNSNAADRNSNAAIPSFNAADRNPNAADRVPIPSDDRPNTTYAAANGYVD